MSQITFDDLSTEWQEMNAASSTSEQRDRLIAVTCRRTEQFWGQIFRRDIIETVAAVFVIFAFGRMQLQEDFNVLERIGCGIVILGAFYIVYRLWNATWRTPATAVDAPLREYCETETTRLETQIGLLQNVLWWYLAPIMGGLALMRFGNEGLSMPFARDLLFYALMTWGLYALNQRAVRKKFVPQRKRLQTLLDHLDHPEREIDESTISEGTEVESKSKYISWGLIIMILFAAVLLFALSDNSYTPDPRSSDATDAFLAPIVAEARKEKQLVGLGAMVMIDGRVVDSAIDGERKLGSQVWLEMSDRWHLGSITKSITATMVARLIESGRMKWTDTVGTYFKGDAVHEDWRSVTIRQLMTHTSGAPANFLLRVRLKEPPPGKKRMQARHQAVMGIISKKPEFSPGENHAYSNVGYTILGTLAEKAIGKPWEDLVELGIYKPLKLAGAGFGPPKSPSRKLPQPRGHRTSLGVKSAMDDDADNTPIMGPCGSAHMTLEDLCNYANEHIKGHHGKGTLLSAENYALLHKPELDSYACGWVKVEPNRALPHTHFWHNGSNTMWYALVVFVPEKNAVVAVASNDGDIKGAESAAWKIVYSAAKQFGFGSDEPAEGYAKLAPYNAIRWQQTTPEVRVDGTWYKLTAIDDVPVNEIVAYSKKQYGNSRWQMRFEEDLVEVLTRMEHPPGDAVALSLKTLDSGETVVKEEVPMTRENRQAIKNAARE